MTTWKEYLIDHYTGRLQQEKRPQAVSFLRSTLYHLKKADATIDTPGCSCGCNHVLVSRVLHNQTKDWATKA